MRLLSEPDAHVAPAARLDLIDAVARSGLRGRGGAGFPAARKLAAVAASRGRSVVVANGCEGEPLSAKDAWLLAHRPQLVLDGAVACARAVGARRVLVCTHGPAELEAALAARRDPVAVELQVLPGTYVAGEETALAHALSGGPPGRPRFAARVYERGVRERPTLVQNVETLAHIALIERHGWSWFRERGTRDDPGTALITVSGAVARAGVTELELGTSLAAMLAAALPSETPRAVLVGGYSGRWVDARDAAAVALEHPLLGCGVLAVLGDGECGVCETGRVLRYLAGESSGQCGPCRFGLRAIAGQFDDLTERGALTRLRRWADDVEGRGACGHPDGAVRLLRSALDTFAVEFADHAYGQHRRAA